MPNPRGKSSSGGGGGRSVPPPDQGPSGNEYRRDEIVKMTLRPGKFEGETVGQPTQGRRTPPVVFMEKMAPGFFPGEEVEVRIVYASPRRAAGEIVGPESVAKENERLLTEALTRSEKFWKENLERPISVRSEKIQKRENRDRSPRFEYEFQDPHDGHMPIKVVVANLPADWDPSKQVTIELAVKSIEIHNRDKRVIGTAMATQFPEPKPSPEQEARQHVRELLADIRDPKGSKELELPLEASRALITKQDGRWIIRDMGEVVYHAEVRLDVPADWSPDKLTADPVVYEMTDARAEGAKILIRCRIQGVEPGPVVEEPKKEAKKDTPKVEIVADKGFGKSVGDTVKGMLTPEIQATLDPVLVRLDSPESAGLRGLRNRLTVLDEVLEELAKVRTHLLAQAAGGDDDALVKLNKLITLRKRVETERKRVDDAIMEAREIWAETIIGIKEDLEKPKAGRIDRLERLKPMVQAAAELRVYKLINGELGLARGLKEIEDIDEVRRLQAENAAVLKQKEDFIDDGTWPEKPGDPDYRLSEMALDFLVAELMVPEYERRIAELERLASGAPTTAAPAGSAPVRPTLDTRLRPLDVPEPVEAGSTAVEVELTEEPEFEDKIDWLRDNGFSEGQFVGVSKKFQKRLERMFGLAAAPETVRIVSIDRRSGEVELEFSGGDRGTVSIDLLYDMGQASAGFANALETAEIATNTTVEFQDEAGLNLLRPRMTAWIEAHPGKPLPKKVRVEGVDLVAGEVALDVEDATDVVRLPLESFSELVTAKKIKVTKEVVPLNAGSRGARLEGPVRLERALSAEVVAGQVYRYDGAPSTHLNPGGNFKVVGVDDEKGLVRVVTAKEEAAADRERRPSQKFLIRADQWRALPKTFVRGPQPEARPGVTAPEAEEDRLLREIEPGQIYVYEGPERFPFKKNDQFRIQTLDAGAKLVSFSIVREEAEAERKKQKVQVYKLKLDQWKLIQKRLLSGGRGGPSAPPEPPAPPSVPPTAGAREAAPARREPTPVTVGVDELPVVTDPRAVPPARRLPAGSDRIGPGTVLEASYPPKAQELQTPRSLTELVDLIRDRNLIELAKAEIKKRAGAFGALLAPFVGDPFGDMVNRIERLATDSGAALSVNSTLLEKLAAKPRSGEVDGAIENLKEQARLYREQEMQALRYTTEQFNRLLSGKKVGTDDERASVLGQVRESLEKLQAANDRARKLLEPPPSSGGTRRVAVRSS